MERLSFLVNRGENDCLMAHGLDWAAYEEAGDWEELAARIRDSVRRDFAGDERPAYIDLLFIDGKIISLCA